MNIRVAFASIAFVLVLATAGCATENGNEPPPAPTATPTSPQTTEQVSEIVGTWEDESVEWVVHFAADGTFTEDFQGHEDFRTGVWREAGGTVYLEGGDGNTSEGTFADGKIKFRLGTLERVKD